MQEKETRAGGAGCLLWEESLSDLFASSPLAFAPSNSR